MIGMIDHVHLHMINHNIFIGTMINFWLKDSILLDQEVQLSEDKMCIDMCIL